jgi:alpha-L-fucosidase
MEMNALLHFTTNIFTEKVGDYGDESPSASNPTTFDADQWVKTYNNIGLKDVILIRKGHDGFCLLPNGYTDLFVKSSPIGQGQVNPLATNQIGVLVKGLKASLLISKSELY